MSHDEVPAFLQALNDDSCRELLATLDGEAKPVRDLSEECDIPLSTAYRKINLLREAGLIAETNLVNDDNKPLKIFTQNLEAALVTPTADGDVEIEFTDATHDHDTAQETTTPERTPTNAVAARSSD